MSSTPALFTIYSAEQNINPDSRISLASQLYSDIILAGHPLWTRTLTVSPSHPLEPHKSPKSRTELFLDPHDHLNCLRHTKHILFNTCTDSETIFLQVFIHHEVDNLCVDRLVLGARRCRRSQPARIHGLTTEHRKD